MHKEFFDKLNVEDLTPRQLLESLQKIPDDYLDSSINLTCNAEYPETLHISMSIDDCEEARKNLRDGNPDYLLFIDLN